MTNSILVIEDEANIRQMLSIALRAEGYDCLEAPTVAKGISIFTKQAPDLVILDMG